MAGLSNLTYDNRENTGIIIAYIMGLTNKKVTN
jgi:hypothetical protein